MNIDFQKIFHAKSIALIQTITQLLDAMKLKGYLVGGMVRDIFLQVENEDWDIAIEQDGMAFARKLAVALQGELVLHPKFLTATIHWAEGQIDVATLRKETYPTSGSLPVVEKGVLREDILRRDFSFNAMAVGLHTAQLGELIDQVDGLKDLENQTLRVLHSKSFLEDPTRILRGFRFKERWGFVFAPTTQTHLLEAVSKNVFRTIHPERILIELRLILKEKFPEKIFYALYQEGVLHKCLYNLCIGNNVGRILKEAVRTRQDNREANFFYAILLWDTPKDKRTEAIVFLGIRQKRVPFFENIDKVKQVMEDGVLHQGVSDVVIYETLRDVPEPILAVFNLFLCEENLNYVERYRQLKSRAKPITNNQDLKRLGIPEGPIYKRLFHQIEKERILHHIQTKEDELRYILKSLER